MTTEELATLFAEGWAFRIEDRPEGTTTVEEAYRVVSM